MHISQRFFLTLFLSGATLPALANEPGNSPHGEQDLLGAINYLSAESVVAASKLVTRGKTYPLGVVTGPETPAWGDRAYRVEVKGFGPESGAEPNGELSGHDDVVHSAMGVGSQIDGLGHIGIAGVHYNNNRASDFFAPDGLKKFGIDQLPPIVGRGVLLDMVALAGEQPLKAGTAFNRVQIQAAAKRQGVTIGMGDIVLFHTGWLPLAESDPATFMQGEPGLGLDGARFLADQGVVAVGADNWALEAMPGENPEQLSPVHQELLAKRGVYILENMNTAELASDQAYEFLFVLGAPRFKGAVQAVINPVAIR